MNRIAALVLSLITILSFVSCAGSKPSENNEVVTTAGNSAESTSASEETGSAYTDDLGKFNFEGEAFNYLSSDATWIHALIDVEAQTGEVLNDAIYQRNRTIEERFNFSFNEVVENGSDVIVKKSILSGADEYDTASVIDRIGLVFAQNELITSIQSLEHINLSKPYWSQTLNKSLSIHDKLYFAYGDFNLTAYDFTHVLAFNKVLAENYQLNDIYDLVKNGEWTYDKYDAYASAVVSDVNGDGVMNASDNYGLLSHPRYVLPGFWIAADVLSIGKDSNDEPYFGLVSDEEFESVIEKIFKITYDNNSWFRSTDGNGDDPTFTGMFSRDQSLFLDTTFFFIESLRGMESDFGIIPFPKLDEAQDDYLARVEGGNVPIVPVTVVNTEFVSVVHEALACESANSVVPAYYDIALKGKYARDNESGEMLDIIFDGMTYDLGDTYWCDLLRDGIFQNMFAKNNREFVSNMKKVEEKVNNELQKTIEAFDAIND